MHRRNAADAELSAGAREVVAARRRSLPIERFEHFNFAARMFRRAAEVYRRVPDGSAAKDADRRAGDAENSASELLPILREQVFRLGIIAAQFRSAAVSATTMLPGHSADGFRLAARAETTRETIAHKIGMHEVAETAHDLAAADAREIADLDRRKRSDVRETSAAG